MSEHPDFRVLLADLVERHGGVAAFSPIQREVAGACVGLMLDMRSAAPGDLVRGADALRRLVEQLPPVVAPSYNGPKVDVMTMSLEEAAQRYKQMVADPCDMGDDLDFTARDAAKVTARQAAQNAYDAAMRAARAATAAAGTVDAPAAEPPRPAAEPAAVAPEPSPAPEPVVEVEPVIRPASHNAGSLTRYTPSPPPAEIIPPAPSPDRDRRYRDKGQSNPFAGRDALLWSLVTMPGGGFPAPPSAMPHGFTAPTPQSGRWGGRSR